MAKRKHLPDIRKVGRPKRTKTDNEPPLATTIGLRGDQDDGDKRLMTIHSDQEKQKKAVPDGKSREQRATGVKKLTPQE